MANPIEQFKIQPLVPLKVAGVDISFTNSSAMMVLSICAITLFLTLSVRSRALVPGRWQSMAEVFYEFIAGMLRDNVGSEGRKYFPFIFSLFMFVLFGNVLGMLPLPVIGFTYTSHVIVTFAMALVVFLGVTAIGFSRHGLHYLRMFFPEGAPIATAVILIPIELISYFSRPFSLAVRLFANMTVGHIILKVMGGFVVSLGAFYLIPGVVPFAFLSAITVLEFGIALLQAYVFTILSCIYLHDAIHMH
ncbi:ATP synthase subunit a [Candidatus Terasakiella magnetica]|nr:ATP synthase subunit a [Candidatus Terasakiella magnetica]